MLKTVIEHLSAWSKGIGKNNCTILLDIGLILARSAALHPRPHISIYNLACALQMNQIPAQLFYRDPEAYRMRPR
jgi:hypothetical protein